MNDIEKRARELLCTAMRLDPEGVTATLIMDMDMPQNGVVPTSDAIRAIAAALAPPEGYVLVPVDLLEDMASEAEAGIHQTIYNPAKRERHMRKVHQARKLLAARPEVSP